jgi:hypothetical protein
MPYRYLVDLYDARKDYGSALATLQSARSVFGSVPDLETRIRSYEQRVKGTPPDTNTPKTK